MIQHLIAEWGGNATHLWWWESFLHPGKLSRRGSYWFYSGLFALSYLTGIWTQVRIQAKHLGALECHDVACKKPGLLIHHASGTRWCYDHAPDELKATHPHRHVHWPELGQTHTS